MNRTRSRGAGAAAVAAFAACALFAPSPTRGEPAKANGASAAASAIGLPASTPGNVELSADLLEVDVNGQTAVLSGKVVLTKGSDLSLKCPKIEVRYDTSGPRVSWAKGSGGVTADVKGVRGEAPEFELDLGKQTLVLRGGVRLYRGQGWVAADGAEIDLATARVSMSNVKASLPVGNALKKP
jgi:lipopolysaccharide export system protein LptA